MFIHVQTYLLSDVITSGNSELLFRSHNAIDLRRGQQERIGAFRPARDIQILSALERYGWQRVKHEEENDEDLNFFRSLVPYMKQLPSTRKLFLKSHFQNMVADEISELQNNLLYLQPQV